MKRSLELKETRYTPATENMRMSGASSDLGTMSNRAIYGISGKFRNRRIKFPIYMEITTVQNSEGISM
jgi:hypothetical protein